MSKNGKACWSGHLLGNQKGDLTTQFIRESVEHEQDLSSLFGNDHGLDSYVTKRRYTATDTWKAKATSC
jgi:5-methylcytosine-specific restriction enzyme B